MTFVHSWQHAFYKPAGYVSKHGWPRLVAARICAMAAAKPVVSHVLWDMDGLLLDTERLYSVAQQQICQKYGREFTFELKTKMMGRKALDAAQVLIDDLQLQGQLTPEEFLIEREALLDVLFATAPLMPGVDRLVRHLAASGVPQAVATSSHKRHFDLKTSTHKELFSLFSHIITGDMVTRSKPDPEIFHVAARAFNPDSPPEAPRCLVFEDAPLGVQAGLAAGMQVVMVPDPQLDAAQCAGAHQVLRSLEDFKPEEWGLPPYPQNGGQ